MVPGDVHGMIAGMRIGPVPSPPVIFALPDGTGFRQHRYRPPSGRPDRRSPFVYRHLQFPCVRGGIAEPVSSSVSGVEGVSMFWEILRSLPYNGEAVLGSGEGAVYPQRGR
jgi:hypothetical protein